MLPDCPKSLSEREEQARSLFKRADLPPRRCSECNQQQWDCRCPPRRRHHKVRAEESNGAVGGNDYRGRRRCHSTRHAPNAGKRDPKGGDSTSNQPTPRQENAQRRQQRLDDQHFEEAFPDLHGKRVPPPIIQAEEWETAYRHSGWQHRRTLVRQALVVTAAKPRTLEAFDNCGANAWVEQYTDDAGGWVVKCQHCKNRWCIPCGNARALLIADNLRCRIDNEPHLHVVLTLKHRDAPLAGQVDRLYKCFKDLRQTKLWKNATDGGAAFFQCKIGRDQLWHPHLHIICRGKWLNVQQLSDAWKQITGDSDNVDVSRVTTAEKAVKEVTRYVSRPADADTVNNADKLAEMMQALSGRHLCFTFGRWRKFRLTKRSEEPHRPTRRVMRLVDMIARSQRGDSWAGKVLEVLTARTNQSHAPPEDDHYFDD